MPTNTIDVNLGAPIPGTIVAPGAAFPISGNISATYAVDPPVLLITVEVDGVAVPVSTKHLQTSGSGQLLLTFDATGKASLSASAQIDVTVTDEDSNNSASARRIVAVQAGHSGPVVPPPVFFIDIASNVGLRQLAFPNDPDLAQLIAKIQSNSALLRLSSLFSAVGAVLVGPNIVTDPPPGSRPLPANTEITRIGFWLVSEIFPVVSGSEPSLPSLTKTQGTDGFNKVPLPTFTRSMLVEFRVQIGMSLVFTLLETLLPTLRAKALRLGLDLQSLTMSVLQTGSGTSLVTSFFVRGVGWPSAEVSGTITETIGQISTPLVGSPCVASGTVSTTVSVLAVTGSSYTVSENVLNQVLASLFIPGLFLEPILLASTLPSLVGKATDQITSMATPVIAAIPSVIPVQSPGSPCPFLGIPLTWSTFGASSTAIIGAGGINATDTINRTQASVSMSLAGPSHIAGHASDLAGGTASEFTVTLSGLVPDGPVVWTVDSHGEVVNTGVVEMSNGTGQFVASFPLPTNLDPGLFAFEIRVTATETSQSLPNMTLRANASQAVAISALRDPKVSP
jgi:hypothetical protein